MGADRRLLRRLVPAVLGAILALVGTAPRALAQFTVGAPIVANPAALPLIPTSGPAPALPREPSSSPTSTPSALRFNPTAPPSAPLPTPTPTATFNFATPLGAESVAASDTATNATYGIADCCTGNTAAFESYYNNTWFQALTDTPGQRGETGGVQLRYVRIFAPYDVLGTYNPFTGKCSWSWDFASDGGKDTTGGSAGGTSSAWSSFGNKLIDAQHDGLTSLVVLRDATSDGQVGGTIPSGTYAGTYAAESAKPDTTQQIQELDYACGIDYLMYWTVVDLIPVSHWEAWNEPDGPGTPYHNPTGTGYGTGTWKAAYLWYTANAYGAAFQATPGFPAESVAALTLSHAQNTGYLDPYVTNVSGIAHCTAGYQPSWGCNGNSGWPTTTPTYWAVHDYDDPTVGATFGGVQDLQSFVSDLAGKGLSPTPQVWVTEAGAQLDSGDLTDANVPGGVTCNNAESDDTNTFGCTLDGSTFIYRQAQYLAGTDWISLGAVHSGSVNTTMVFWYMYALQNFQSFFDSALVDASGNGRGSYCALYGIPYANLSDYCPGNPLDYESTSGL